MSKRLPDEAYHLQWIERVKARCIVDSNGCWVWQGSIAINGYGLTAYRAHTTIISRRMFQIWHGVQLERREYVCHTCDVKLCCNPAHLWKGNNGLNKKDETAKGKNYFANRTHCPHGHEYTPENTYRHQVRPGVWSRSCKACGLERGRRMWRERPEYMRERLRKYRALKRVSA